ncbi:hypothetical protein BDW69DRAFT_180788 [Aspergillus filifer]
MAFLKKMAVDLIGEPIKAESSEETMSNGLFINDIVDDMFGEPWVESPGSYCPGRYHPIHLGDHLGEEAQYKVIRKLGFGETSTVWLCVFKEGKYVAVKVHAATASNRELQVTQRLVEAAKADAAVAQYCILPTDQFQIKGPNGTHWLLSSQQLGQGQVY